MGRALPPGALALLEYLDTRRRDVLRVLAYGAITDADALARQLEHLERAHPIASALQVLDAIEGAHPLPPRALLLTFELQGFRAFALPALVRANLPAVLFVPPEAAGELAAELDRFARAGVTVGLRATRADPVELAGAYARLDESEPGLPRVVAHSGGEANVAAARTALAELGVTDRAGANALHRTDRQRLRSIAVDAAAGPRGLRETLVRASARWSDLLGGAAPLTDAERRDGRAVAACRRRARFVAKPLDALLTASLRPRPSGVAALRALCALRSSNYERMRGLARLAAIVPGVERALARRLLDTRRIALRAPALELAGYGTAATVFRLAETPSVLKVYRWSAGWPAAELAQMARRHRGRYRVLRHHLGDHLLRTHFLVLHGPLRGRAVAAVLQERVVRARDLLALSDAELLALLRARAELAADFADLGRRVLALAARGLCADVLGRGNLLLVEEPGPARVRLIDYGLFDLRSSAPELPRAALRAAERRFVALLSALPG